MYGPLRKQFRRQSRRQSRKHLGGLFLITVLLLAACATNQERPVFNSKAADLNAQLGDGYAQQGRYQRSIEKYSKALVFNPKLDKAYLGAISVASQTGDRQLAERFLQKFVEASPEKALPYESYAAFYCRAGEFLEAEKKLLEALSVEAYASKSTVYNRMTACARDVQRFDLAEIYNGHARKIAPSDSAVLLQTAMNHHAQSNVESTLAALNNYYENGGVDAQWLQLAVQLAKVTGNEALEQQWRQRVKILYPLMQAQ